jgi:predicted PurR-regulated permease PerM
LENNRWFRALIILGVIFVGIQLFAIAWVFFRGFADILLIFVIAWLLAFLLNPAVEFFTIGHRTPRVLAVAAVYLCLAAVLAIIGLLVIPPTAAQVLTLSDHFPQYANEVSSGLSSTQGWLNGHGIPVNLETLAGSNDLLAKAQAVGAVVAANALGLAQGVALTIFNCVIILVISFYIMLDSPRIIGALAQVTPEHYRDDAELLIASMDRSFGGFLRASLVLMFVYGAGTALAMFLLGVPAALPVGVFAGVVMIIPLVGAIVAVLPPVAIALATVSLGKALILLVIMILLQQLVLQVLQPRIMGKSVGLHPLWVLASVLVGARVAGVWGALFAVPVAAIVQTIVQVYYFRAAGNEIAEGAISSSLLGDRDAFTAVELSAWEEATNAAPAPRPEGGASP